MGLEPKIYKNQAPNPIFYGLVLSISIHALFIFFRASDTTPQWQKDLEASAPVEITQVPPQWLQPEPSQPAPKELPRSKEPQVVESEKVDNEIEDPNAQFLGERNQTVEEQTKAKLVDDFRENLGTGLKNQNVGQENTPPPTADKLADQTGDSGDIGIGTEEKTEEGGIKRDWKTLSLKDLGMSGNGRPAGATDDYLRDIGEGERTVLSTKEFQYFSYYNRIKQLLRQHWKPTVQRNLSQVWRKGGKINQSELTTRIMVLLTNEGKLQRVQRVAGSGVRELDSAAEEAFEKAAPFPNPPKGIIDADGFVRIRWDFILKLEAAPTIQFRNAGQLPRY